MTIEKKVQDCDQTYEYYFEFNVNVKFETQGIRIPDHEIEAFQQSIASRIEEGAYLDPQYMIGHTCYEIDGKDRDELMKDQEFFKTHAKHSTDIGDVDVDCFDWNMEEWET